MAKIGHPKQKEWTISKGQRYVFRLNVVFPLDGLVFHLLTISISIINELYIYTLRLTRNDKKYVFLRVKFFSVHSFTLRPSFADRLK